MFFVHYPLKFGVLALVSTLTVLLPFGDAGTEARDPIPIVVTIPILKDLAEQVGGPYVRVTSLLSG